MESKNHMHEGEEKYYGQKKGVAGRDGGMKEEDAVKGRARGGTECGEGKSGVSMCGDVRREMHR